MNEFEQQSGPGSPTRLSPHVNTSSKRARTLPVLCPDSLVPRTICSTNAFWKNEWMNEQTNGLSQCHEKDFQGSFPSTIFSLAWVTRCRRQGNSLLCKKGNVTSEMNLPKARPFQKSHCMLCSLSEHSWRRFLQVRTKLADFPCDLPGTSQKLSSDGYVGLDKNDDCECKIMT